MKWWYWIEDIGVNVMVVPHHWCINIDLSFSCQYLAAMGSWRTVGLSLNPYSVVKCVDPLVLLCYNLYYTFVLAEQTFASSQQMRSSYCCNLFTTALLKSCLCRSTEEEEAREQEVWEAIQVFIIFQSNWFHFNLIWFNLAAYDLIWFKLIFLFRICQMFSSGCENLTLGWFQDINVEFVESFRSTGRDRWTWIFTQVAKPSPGF